MIAEIGHYALVLALFLSLVQASLPLWGAARDKAAWMGLAAPAAIGQAVFILGAFLALTYLYVVSDFTVANVAANSHSAKPLLYKISGVWGNHEGSMVLWVMILAFFGAAVALFGSNLPPTLKSRVLAVQGMIGAGFLLFILLTSNPFLRLLPPPVDGGGLNPILQDPGLAFHPPFLYLGYVGFSMAFSFAVAALIEGRVDAAWARWVRPWTLAAWAALTLGIAMGSWWAYYELGWGGWWFWDPVENASLMPWLAGTALLHSAIVVEKRDALKSWTIFLAILTFGLSLLGTFLVRSGVLTSVHSFANDPERGVFILLLMILSIGGALTLYALRAPGLKGGGLFAPISREGALVLNNLLLTTAVATVLIGTLYPLILDVLGGGKVSVGPPFFNFTFVPIVAPMVLAMAIGPSLAWKRGDIAALSGRLWVALAGAVLLGLVAWYVFQPGPVLAVVAFALAAWLTVGTVLEFAERIKLTSGPPAAVLRRMRTTPRALHGMTLAHLGLAVAIIGMTGTAWQKEVVTSLAIGGEVALRDYTFRLESVGTVQGPNYEAERATLRLMADGRLIAVMQPENRFFRVSDMQTTEAAIRTTGMADIYAVMGDEAETEEGAPRRWAFRFYHNPLIPWIWAGTLLMVFGGLVSLSDRRYRIGAPRRAPAGAAQPSAVAGE